MQKVGNINKILSNYPFLNFIKEERTFTGYICIDDDDRYYLSIDISSFPKRFPKVIEINERIPRKADRHINNDNSLCFTTKTNEEILLKTAVTDIEAFFKQILIPYLINNSYYEINKEYKYGEYSHNAIHSILETYNDFISIYVMYKEILGVDNFELISNILRNIVQGKKYRPNELCYCGSNKKIKKCKNHENGYRKVKKISSHKLSFDSIAILKLREELIKMNNKVPNKI